MTVGKIAGPVLAMILLAAVSADAALPPAAYEQWVKEFRSAVEVEALVSFNAVTVGLADRVKMLLGQVSFCTASYTVETVIRQPQGLGLDSGAEITLTYPCGKDMKMEWLGSRLPWAEPGEGASLNMAVRAVDILAKDGHFALDNSKNIFGPVFPVGYGE